MGKKYKNNKITIEDYALAFGSLIIAFGISAIFSLPTFITICLFFVIYLFLDSRLKKSKEKRIQEERERQESIRLKAEELRKKERENLFILQTEEELKEQEEKKKDFEPDPRQITLYDLIGDENNSVIEKKKEKKTVNKKQHPIDKVKKQENIEVKKVIPKNNSNFYVFEYDNETEFRKLERSIKKYNMLAFKKLYFEYYPSLKDGKFLGKLISSNKTFETEKYELELPTDKIFKEVHDTLILHYTVYKKEKVIFLNTITPTEILLEGHKNELLQYKGVMISKSHSEKDMFKINLLNMINKD